VPPGDYKSGAVDLANWTARRGIQRYSDGKPATELAIPARSGLSS